VIDSGVQSATLELQAKREATTVKTLSARYVEYEVTINGARYIGDYHRIKELRTRAITLGIGCSGISEVKDG